MPYIIHDTSLSAIDKAYYITINQSHCQMQNDLEEMDRKHGQVLEAYKEAMEGNAGAGTSKHLGMFQLNSTHSFDKVFCVGKGIVFIYIVTAFFSDNKINTIVLHHLRTPPFNHLSYLTVVTPIELVSTQLSPIININHPLFQTN